MVVRKLPSRHPVKGCCCSCMLLNVAIRNIHTDQYGIYRTNAADNQYVQLLCEVGFFLSVIISTEK